MHWLLPVLLAGNIDWARDFGGRVEANTQGQATGLYLRGSWVTDSDLDYVARQPQLEKLDLSLTRITDLGLLRLKNLQNMRELTLFFAELVTDEGLAVVKNWPRIERLNFRGTKVTDNTLSVLAGKDSIRALDISYAEVTDSGLQHLPKLKGLRELSFGGNKMTEVGLEVLRSLPGLTKLDISGRQRTDSGLWFVGVTDIGLDPVAVLADLRELNLSGTLVSPKGVQKLGNLRKLEKLDLHGAKRVTDEAPAYLAALPALRWVDLKDTAMTVKGFAELRRLRPELVVAGDPAAGKKDHYTVDFENEYVRAVRVHYGPREVSKTHPHPENPGVVYVYLNDAGPMKFVHDDGRSLERPPVKAGGMRVAHGAKETHEATNLSDGASEYIRLDLKTQQPEKLRDQRIQPVTPTAADNWTKTVFESSQFRLTRLACVSRASCAANELPAIDVRLPDGAILWLPKGSPARYNEAPLPLDLVRVEFKTGPAQ